MRVLEAGGCLDNIVYRVNLYDETKRIGEVHKATFGVLRQEGWVEEILSPPRRPWANSFPAWVITAAGRAALED